MWCRPWELVEQRRQVVVRRRAGRIRPSTATGVRVADQVRDRRLQRAVRVRPAPADLTSIHAPDRLPGAGSRKTADELAVVALDAENRTDGFQTAVAVLSDRHLEQRLDDAEQPSGPLGSAEVLAHFLVAERVARRCCRRCEAKAKAQSLQVRRAEVPRARSRAAGEVASARARPGGPGRAGNATTRPATPGHFGAPATVRAEV